MPRRPPVGLLVLALLLTGCSKDRDRPVAVDAVPLAPASCAAVVTALPSTLGTASRRDVTPDRGSTAAWGKPPVVLRCGVAEGSPLDDEYVFDGVRWGMHDTGASRTWTTRGRAVPVQVVIPDAYDGQAELLGSLAAALATAGR